MPIGKSEFINEIDWASTEPFTKGEIVVYQSQFDDYKFVVYLGPAKQKNRSMIFTKQIT